MKFKKNIAYNILLILGAIIILDGIISIIYFRSTATVWEQAWRIFRIVMGKIILAISIIIKSIK